MTERQRRDLGEIRLELLQGAGYRWRATPPEGFFNTETGDLIAYVEALDASFSELARRIAAGKPLM